MQRLRSQPSQNLTKRTLPHRSNVSPLCRFADYMFQPYAQITLDDLSLDDLDKLKQDIQIALCTVQTAKSLQTVVYTVTLAMFCHSTATFAPTEEQKKLFFTGTPMLVLCCLWIWLDAKYVDHTITGMHTIIANIHNQTEEYLHRATLCRDRILSISSTSQSSDDSENETFDTEAV